ncbi:hypothetical protein L9F63_004475, partial [Diploptera punctata]
QGYENQGGCCADDDGKGWNIWDTLTHQRPDYIFDKSNGDVACDSYHKYKEDIQLLKQLGVNFYRFSISWARILPKGYANYINKYGIDYYNNLINELLANSIQPMVTMYHWDLPEELQDIGGWPNIKLADYFEDYARLLFTHFGDRVKLWITFNEPASFVGGYGSTGHLPSAPAIYQPGIADYLAAHTVIHAHAKVYHMYYREFKKQQKGKIGITLNAPACKPDNSSINDEEACERLMQFNLGYYAHPIFSKEGDYPDVMKERITKNSKEEGYPASRLPTFSKREIKHIRGTYDFFGMNVYTGVLAKDGEMGPIPSLLRDGGVKVSQDPTWPSSASAWLKVVPWSMRAVLNWISKEYNNPTVIVTENGFSDHGELNDTARIKYYISYLKEMLKAIHEDGCNVIGYAAWILLDNFEWNRGYTEKFGLYHVDFNDPTRPRTEKQSARIYREIIKTRKIPPLNIQEQNSNASVNTPSHGLSIALMLSGFSLPHVDLTWASNRPREFLLLDLIVCNVATFIIWKLGTAFATKMACGCESTKESECDKYSLPEGFLLGVASSSYQIEGGWNEDGKSVNIWDTVTHLHPEYIADGSTGDIACDSYHKYKEDIEMCKDLG